MSVTVRSGVTKFGSPTAVTTISVSSPASTQVGDLICVMVEMKGTTQALPAGPDGSWSVATGTQYLNSATGAVAMAIKVATGAGSQAFTFGFIKPSDGSALTTIIPAGICFAVGGQKASGPVVAMTAGASGTTSPITFPTVTPTDDAELILRVLGGQVASGGTDEKTPTWDGAVTSLGSAQGNSGTSTGAAFLTASYEVGPTPAAAVAARTLTLQNAPSSWGRITYGILAAPTGTPSATVAPAVTGTAAVGSVLTCDGGTWNQSVTLAYQWQRDTVNISGATGSTYTVVSADAGHTLQCVVSATNTNGTGTATSNGTAIPSAPVNTVAPVVTTDGTPATGETITVDTGTWTGTGITYAYQWYRGASPISGETANSYTLTVTDEGANISARVTATNGGGSTTANSNTIVPAVTAPISDDSGLTYLSGGTGNTDPSLSIGGARGGTYSGGLNGLIGPILGTVAQAGGTFYRVIYMRNTHTINTASGLKLFLEQQFSHAGVSAAVAVPTQGVNTTVPALASGTTAPTGVTWITTTDPTAGAAFGNLGPGDYRGVYVRVAIAPGTTLTTEDDATIAYDGTAA